MLLFETIAEYLEKHRMTRSSDSADDLAFLLSQATPEEAAHLAYLCTGRLGALYALRTASVSA